MTATLVVFLTVQSLTVTLESQRFSTRRQCLAKLEEMMSVVVHSGLPHIIESYYCQRQRKRNRYR